MSIMIDLIIVGIVALCTIVGYVRGLTKVLLKILSFFLAIVIAFVLFKPISMLIINQTQIDDTIQTAIEEKMVGTVADVGENIENNMTEESNMPEVMTDYLEKVVEEGKATGENAAKEAAKKMTDIIVDAGTWIIVFLVTRIILFFAKSLLELIVKLPVIEQMDKVGGVAYGLIEGILIIYIGFAILSFVSPMFDSNSILSSIQNAAIGGYLYDNNIILKVIF